VSPKAVSRPCEHLRLVEQRQALLQLFQTLAHGNCLAFGDQHRRGATHLPGKDGGERKFLSETEGPEDLQNRSQPRQRLVIRQVVVRQPMRGAGEYLAQEGTSRLRRVQAVGPAAEGGGIGDAIGVFELWRRLLPGTVFDKASP